MRGVAAPRIVEHLRPKPFRGDVVAAGVLVLTTLAWLLRFRFADDWADGVHLLYGAAVAVLVATIAALAPLERETPRAYQSVLYVATVALALLALVALAAVLGGHGGAGEVTWVAAATAATALAFAAGRNSAVATLLGAIAAGIAAVAAVEWVTGSDSARTIRWVLLGLVVVFMLLALAHRDRRRAHAVAAVDAAGLAAVAIGVTLAGEALFSRAVVGSAGAGAAGAAHVAWGWQLLLLAAGFGLIAYSSVDRERGPAWLGVLCLLLFLAVASSGGFAGWPLVLLAIAVALLAIGLRPTTPAPPPPDADAPPAPAEPLHR